MDKYDRRFIVAVTLIAFYLIAGTFFFHMAEGWSFVDSFYFSGTTLTTVGYGDLTPSHDLTKIVAVLFMFSGIGIVFYSIGILGQKYFEREEERLQKIWEGAQQRKEEIRERREELLAKTEQIATAVSKPPIEKVTSKLRMLKRRHIMSATQKRE